ncbi:nucleotidyltransferase family protein [Micromonospora sp. CA-240977]|uniref:nucleotidyltransferase family protein n=1 Tax=Micromonospora sp. CA-240977 TaxID=3239957 RepID=UPI003D8BDC59
MHEAHENQRKVWQLLESVAATDYSDSWFEQAVGLAKDLEDPDLLIALAARHKMVPALAHFYSTAALNSTLPIGMRDLLNGALAWNRFKVEKLRAESLDIAAGFAERGVPVVFNKGIVLQQSLYDGLGVRSFGDVDLMLHPDHVPDARAVLEGLGYLPEQTFDPDLGGLVKLPRETLLMYRLYPDHVPHFHRVDPESGIPVYKVDVALSPTWFGSAWQLPMTEVMGSAGQTRVGPDERHLLPTLGDGYAFLFVVLHLFRDSWFERAIAVGELRVTQFGDVWRFWQRWGRQHPEELRTLIKEYGVGPAVAWITHHVDALFGSTMTAELGLQEFCDPVWLASAGGMDGGFLAWDGDMRTRLFNRAPVALTPIDEPPYGADARGKAS